jgi:hypothetical protein
MTIPSQNSPIYYITKEGGDLPEYYIADNLNAEKIAMEVLFYRFTVYSTACV